MLLRHDHVGTQHVELLVPTELEEAGDLFRRCHNSGAHFPQTLLLVLHNVV